MAVSSCDPSTLDNLARCVSSCGADSLSVKTYLLCQLLSQSTPPCVTPTAPINPTAKVITNTTILIIWNQISNSGSLITSYTVKWGTVSGVYTNSATVGASPKNYTITGLTAGTQYFFVVQANSSAAVGCSSANSNEGTGTTTGASPGNHLLNGLVTYWSYDTNNGATFPDLQDGNDLLFGGGTIVGGLIGLCFAFGINGNVALAPCPANMQLGAGKSFSISAWLNGISNAAQTGQIAQFSNVVATSAWMLYTAAGPTSMRLDGYTGGVTATLLNIGTLTNAWNHVVFGFDSPNQQLFAYFNNGAKITQATTGDLNGVAANYDAGNVVGQTRYGGAIDETGFWNRVLSATDVANLFNGGAGLPFTSFTP